MLLATLAIIVGFALLVWSADKFVEGAAETEGRVETVDRGFLTSALFVTL